MPTNLTRISRFGFVNAYLVSEDDGLTLVDTLVPRSAKAVLRAAQGLGAPIVRIALTHAPADHIGSPPAAPPASPTDRGAPRPGVEFLFSPRDARLLHKDMSLDPGEPQRKLRGSYPGAETRPTRALAAGDMVGSLEVVAAPGHTPGHVAFFARRDGTLLFGDTYTTMGRVATTDKVRLPFPLASMATWDPATELASARALRALDPAALAPGHGKIVDAPAAAMDAALAKASA